jgi:hypothetical protein
MLTKRTRLDRIEIDAAGQISVKAYKEVLEGKQILFSEPHRTVIPHDRGVDEQMLEVSAHLKAMGFAPLDSADIAMIKRHADIIPRRRDAVAQRAPTADVAHAKTRKRPARRARKKP